MAYQPCDDPSQDSNTTPFSDMSDWSESMSFENSSIFTSEASHSVVFTSSDYQTDSFFQYEDGSSETGAMTNGHWNDTTVAPGTLLPAPCHRDSYRDFTLFDTSTTITDWPIAPLFHQSSGESHVHRDIVIESPAVVAARRSLYVSKGTSIPTDLPEPPARSQPSPSSHKSKRHRNVARSRKSTHRHACTINSCSMDFGRASDLLRHQHDFHRLSTKHFECESNYCLYCTRRADKMKEHCQKMHRHEKGKEVFRMVQSEEFTATSRGSSSSPLRR